MKTIDEFGNESSLTSYNIAIQYMNIDVPEIMVTGMQIGTSYVLGSVITITSGGTEIYVAINHGSVGEFIKYTEPISLNETGSYYIRAKTIDERDTDSEETIVSLNVVEECYVAPTIQVTGTGTNPYYQSATVTLSGVTDLQYKINDGAWIDYTVPFVLDIEGEYTISYRNDDACQTVYTRNIVIDKTPPLDAVLTIVGT